MRWTVKSGKQRFDHRVRRTRARTDEERTANLPDLCTGLTSKMVAVAGFNSYTELLPPTSSAVYGRGKFPGAPASVMPQRRDGQVPGDSVVPCCVEHLVWAAGGTVEW